MQQRTFSVSGTKRLRRLPSNGSRCQEESIIMLKKKIATIITAVTRLCSKCGKTVTLSTTDDKTVCECGEVIYDAKNDNSINGETIHEKAGLEASDSSTESRDSE